MGLANAAKIVEKYAVPRGWPAGIALQYLTMYLKYQIGPQQLEAIRMFHAYAEPLGLLTGPKTDLQIVESTEVRASGKTISLLAWPSRVKRATLAIRMS